MQNSGQCPDLVTYIGVLSACSHAGFMEEGLEHFKSMKNHGLVPQIEHYSCVIDLFGRTGKLEEMEDLVAGGKPLAMAPCMNNVSIGNPVSVDINCGGSADHEQMIEYPSDIHQPLCSGKELILGLFGFC